MKKKQCYIALVTLPIIGLSILYLGGYLGQFIRNYKEWQSKGSYTSQTYGPEMPTFTIKECFQSAINPPYGILGILICMGLFLALFLVVMRLGLGKKVEYDRKRNLIYSKEGTYGTAGFMTEKEREVVLDLSTDLKNNKETILGQLDKKIVCMKQDSRMNKNIAVYGASGSMKSRAYARNMIFQSVRREESLIITDPKSELFEDMSDYLKKQGYTVRVFNLVHPEYSDSWNCLAEVEGSELMAQTFTDVIIKNTGSEKADHFWNNAEQNLLKALVLFVDHSYPKEGKNIAQVYHLLTMTSEQVLNEMFAALPLTHPAKVPYNIYKQASDTVRSGVIIGLGGRLQVFQSKLIQSITNFDEIDLTLPGKEKCAYFCITSDQESTFDFLSSLFLAFLFIKLVRYADHHGRNGKLPVPVHILADELANVGNIPDLNKKISTIRSRDISISCIFQNLAQMQNRYPLNQWQEILGNCDVQLFLGCTDDLTAKFISDRTGEITIDLHTTAKTLGTFRVSDYSPEYRQTQSTGKRKLLTMDEVLRLPINQALVILRGQKVLLVDKFDYTLHPDHKHMISAKATDHIPEWKKKESKHINTMAVWNQNQRNLNITPTRKKSIQSKELEFNLQSREQKSLPKATKEVETVKPLEVQPLEVKLSEAKQNETIEEIQNLTEVKLIKTSKASIMTQKR